MYISMCHDNFTACHQAVGTTSPLFVTDQALPSAMSSSGTPLGCGSGSAQPRGGGAHSLYLCFPLTHLSSTTAVAPWPNATLYQLPLATL